MYLPSTLREGRCKGDACEANVRSKSEIQCNYGRGAGGVKKQNSG